MYTSVMPYVSKTKDSEGNFIELKIVPSSVITIASDGGLIALGVNDYNSLLGCVAKSGDTMTGDLAIQKSGSNAIMTLDTDLVSLGDTPTARTNTGSIYFHKNGTLSAIIQNFTTETGQNGLQLITRKPDNSGWGASISLFTNASGTIGMSFPQCTTKATTTSTAGATIPAVVIQNYCSGTSWYRVWSDGWIEQGGQATSNHNGTKFTFVKTFSNTNYTVTLSRGASGSYEDTCCTAYKNSASQITVYGKDDGLRSIYACGY